MSTLLAQTELAEQHEHESACELITATAEVNTEFISVFEELNRLSDSSVGWGAAGCGGCFHTDADIGAFWVAQNDAVEKMYVNYGGDSLKDAKVAEMIMEAATNVGVDADWRRPLRAPLGDGLRGGGTRAHRTHPYILIIQKPL